MKKIITGLLLFFPLVSFASTDAVTLNNPVINGCGFQVVDMAGTTTYSNPNNYLVISLDGVADFTSHTQTPTFDFQGGVDIGTHTLEADILNLSSTVLASSIVHTNIADCSVPSVSTNITTGVGLVSHSGGSVHACGFIGICNAETLNPAVQNAYNQNPQEFIQVVNMLKSTGVL